MAAVRNIQLKLDVPEPRREDLEATFEEFRQAAQLIACTGWSDDPTEIVTTKKTLHNRTYERARDQFNLQASLIQTARDLAVDALESCKSRLLDGERASKPEFKGTVVVHNRRTVSYNRDHVTLATISDRVRADIVAPEDPSGTPLEKYWADEWEKKGATLHKRDGTYYLHVVVEKDVDTSVDESENGVVLGVDLNVNGYLAVTSTGAFLGNADFLNHQRREYERRRGNLQQTGTRSAHLTIQSIGDKFARWSGDFLHRVSKALVQEALAHGCTHIAFENLENIRDRISNAAKFQQWAFREVQEQTKYKAEERGIVVETVSPHYTSQKCSHTECGYTHKDNRDGEKFECIECGNRLHSDYNAARNIGWKLVQHRHKSGAGRATCQLALKSGALNANGGYTHAAASG